MISKELGIALAVITLIAHIAIIIGGNYITFGKIRKKYEVTLPQPYDDDWTLNTEQMIWMMQHHNLIERVMAAEDFSDLQAAMDKSDEYIRLFGDMTFDEAYDRYECMLGD